MNAGSTRDTTLSEQLLAGLGALGLSATDEQQRQLLTYIELLQKWNQVYNLTAVRDVDRMLGHHVLDSLAALPALEGESLSVLDVGSGGGMPGIPFAILRPDWRVVLLDANHKKTTFLRQAVIELGLNTVEVVCERVENFHTETGFHVITSRAFSELGEFVRLTRHVLAEGGIWAALKGVYPYEEIAQLPAEVKVQSVLALNVPMVEADRHLVRLVVAS